MIIRADARHIPLADGSVQMCVTSPPYWGLRDYGTARWNGGNEECDHAVRRDPRIETSGLGGGKSTTGHQREGFKNECPRCGARRIDAQIGLEPTPEAYVATMVQVFRQVRRVLRDDGTLWLNLGDSYSSGGRTSTTLQSLRAGGKERETFMVRPPVNDSIKPKDLCGIPWRVAFALQADGWYLRSDIIWAKPNPMPESVTDRPTRSHEYLFLLSKRERYYYDSDAIREDAAESSIARISQPNFANQTGGPKDYRNGVNPSRSMRQTLENFAMNPGRNKRDVWTINSEPTPEAHFATFPQKLIEPCILAGSRVGDLVFDPFLGSGTVGKVCERLGRRWAGLELSADYIAIARKRTAQRGLFGSMTDHEQSEAGA